MTERASIFESESDFDVSGFAAKQDKRAGEASPEVVREVSQGASFRSREPLPAQKTETQESPKREPRRYRTGRNVQLNIKVRAETVESFYEMADREGWVLGETFEHAIAALRRERSAQQRQDAPS